MLYLTILLILIIGFLLPIVSGMGFYLSMKPIKKPPIMWLFDYLDRKDKLHYLIPCCILYLNLFLNSSKTTFNLICILSSLLTVMSASVRAMLFLEYLGGEHRDNLFETVLPIIHSSSFNFLLFIGILNLVFRVVVNWSRLIIVNLIYFHFEGLIEIKERSLLISGFWRPLIMVTFHKTVEKLQVISQISPNNSQWTKMATLTGVGVFATGVYLAGETHWTRTATEKAADAAVMAADAAVMAADAAVRAADVAEVQAGLMTKEQFNMRNPKK